MLLEWPGRDLLLGIDPVHRLVHRRRRLAEAAGDQLELPGIGRHVARRLDAGAPRLHQLVDDDLVLLQREPPVGDRPDVAHEAEHRQHDVGLDLASSSSSSRRLSTRCVNRSPVGLHRTSASSWKVNIEARPASTSASNCAHRGAVRAEAVAAVHERHVRRHAAQLRRPVERRVAAADDHHALPRVLLRVGDDVVDAAPVPRLGARLRQAPRREGADPGGDDDRLAWDTRPCRCRARSDRRAPRARSPPGRGATGSLNCAACSRERPHEVLRQHLGDSRRRRR